MNDPVPQEVIEHLIMLGESDPQNLPHDQLRILSGHGRWNRAAARSWDLATVSLTRESLAALARGVVLAEESNIRWTAGSVSGAIPVFLTYERRFRDHSRELAEWILANSRNPYLPFGTNRGFARSLAELAQRNSAIAKAKEAVRLQEVARAELGAARKRARIEAMAIRHQKHRANRPVREQLAKEIADLGTVARIEHVARDSINPLNLYPASIAAEAAAVWNQLRPETQSALLEKASMIDHQPWLRLARLKPNPQAGDAEKLPPRD